MSCFGEGGHAGLSSGGVGDSGDRWSSGLWCWEMSLVKVRLIVVAGGGWGALGLASGGFHRFWVVNSLGLPEQGVCGFLSCFLWVMSLWFLLCSLSYFGFWTPLYLLLLCVVCRHPKRRKVRERGEKKLVKNVCLRVVGGHILQGSCCFSFCFCRVMVSVLFSEKKKKS